MVETKFAASSTVPETPIWKGARRKEPTFSRPRNGPGIMNRTATSTTTRVLTQRGSRLRGGSLIICDTAGARSAGLRGPYAEPQVRSIPCQSRAPRNPTGLPLDGPASLFVGTVNQPGQAIGNRRRQV